ncbi:winged helix family two component transcriptional regulator [Rhizobium subbaraonis]|uniref:Winged helix family two component transcriptional regulator n=1 Tax=Rhizobium subbaraonis TaxID=908946 RepID=A0A285U4L0_9HYPH|nr:response regulator [Rhizobium subbaraonis]SOC36759.1 winged helix family two component transcriptional regulator [Rhizobium subbaraonis]
MSLAVASPLPEIFVVDDEPGLRSMIEDYLSLQGFVVSAAENGAALDRLLAARRPAAIVLDVNMPGEDGLSIVRRLRGRAERMGIVMLTANADETSKVAGLSYGADDYIVKPFELRELLARLRSVLRRLPAPAPPSMRPAEGLAFGAFRLDPDGRRLFDGDGVEIGVSSMEFDLLETFARHPRQVLSRDRLCELAHGRPLGEADRSVDIRIARLRRKLAATAHAPLLRTVRGEGYVFDP